MSKNGKKYFKPKLNDGIRLGPDEIEWLAEAIWEQFDTSNQNVCLASLCANMITTGAHAFIRSFERVTHTERG